VIWLVRHAATEWSVSRRHTGLSDIPLTDEGRERARELAGVLASERFAAVLCSPLSRARETAELAGFTAPEIVDDLVEWDYGEYEGVTTAEIRETRPGWYLWRDGAPGGESPDEVAARADRVVERLLGAEGDVAVFSHGHFLRMLAGRWIELAPDGGGRLALSTGSVSVLGFEREVRVIHRWNET
jgi:broad specificity phosphatase PhoE